VGGIWTIGEILVEVMRPERGQPLHEAGTFLGPFPSGAPAIFADAVARLGHPAGIVGAVGDDGFGRCAVERLRSDGVDCDSVDVLPGGSTAVAFVSYGDDGSRSFIFHIAGTPAVLAQAGAFVRMQAPDVLHVMGCSLMADEGLRREIVGAVEALAERGTRISFDPNIRPELLGERSLEEVVGPVLRRTAFLLPGEAEVRMLTGVEEEADGVSRLWGYPSLEAVVVKRGAEGCGVYTRDTGIDVPAFPVEEVDPTGAGDCFDAGFLCGMLEGRTMEACGRMAAAAGAINAAAFGPMEGAISREAVRQVACV